MLLLAVFKYAQDSVLVVDRPAFDACNATEPLAAFTDGSTTVRLDRPGFFCFISGEPGHCQQGQRLMVRVMVHPSGLAAAAPAPGILAQAHSRAGAPGRRRGARPPPLPNRSLPPQASPSWRRWLCLLVSCRCSGDHLAFTGKLSCVRLMCLVVVAVPVSLLF